MDNDPIQLEHQTAPESTRGLFDPPETKPPLNSAPTFDKRRSLQSYSPLIDTTNRSSSSSSSSSFSRGHQRSRSAVMLGNFGGRRGSGLLHTLTEEAAAATATTTTTTEDDKKVTVDSLQDMINTLKSLPPVTIKEGGGQQQQQVMPSPSTSVPTPPQRMPQRRRSTLSGADTMQNMVQNTVQELRNIDRHSVGMVGARRRSRRASSMTSTLEASVALRDAALAETEAKLLGTFAKIEEDEPDATMVPPTPIPRRHSVSRPIMEDPPIIRPRRRYSESSSGFDLSSLHNGSLGGGPKRMSLQQLPTLAENGEMSSSLRSGRRLTFNKPLTLEDSNKRLSNGPSSAGHSRRSSRNLDYDWRSSTGPILAPASALQSFNLVPFTPTRVSFAKDDANPHQRRPLFIAHLPFSALPPLFRSRQLVRGMLRVNKRNRSDAYVTCEELDADVYICGSRDRNRALEGDVVAVRLVDVDKVLREKREKEDAKIARNGGKTRTRMPDEEDENEIIFGGDDDVETVKPKYCGVVVAVLERAQNQVFSGTLTLMRPNNKRAQEEKAAEQARLAEGEIPRKEAPRIVWFKATDKRVPLIAIPIEQVPTDFIDKSEHYATRLFVGSIKRWPITSLHPFGYLERELGQVSELDVQVMAILADNNVTDSEFGEAVMACLPSLPAQLPDTNDRRDCTNMRLFTIDPANSSVLDDGFSIRKMGDDTYEVGVHVSDVSHYIQPHSALDKEARARGVRVDLVSTHVPMLPETLTHKVTNLEPNETRLGISVIWTMNSQGQIFNTWVGKSLIRSSAKFTYEEAQSILEKESTSSEIEQDIRSLLSIGAKMRATRLDQGGAMSLMREELSFACEQGYQIPPTAVSPKNILAAEKYVKEIQLRANITVAQKISSHLPEQAMLRRHAPPLDRKIRELQQYAGEHLNVKLDIASANALEQSVQAIVDPQLRKLVTSLVLKTFQPPKYFCIGTFDILKYSHYALSVPLFTHFTAPSRRYSDIIVHRQLTAAFDDDKEFYLDRDTVQKLAQHCNVKKEAARIARDQSNLLFLARHLCAKQQPPSNSIAIFRDAIVVAVTSSYFDVMVPDYNLEKRVHLAHLPVWSSKYDATGLTMYWKKGVSTPTGCNSTAQVDFDEEEEEDMDEDVLVEEMEQDHASPSQQVVMATPLSTRPMMNGGVGGNTYQQHQQQQIPTRPRRASVLRARLSDSTGYSHEQSSQTLKPLDRIKVVVIVEMSKPPPVVRVLAANPFA
ncbi:rnb-domain-containing protein [Lichtheimia corymbifera JMRC:FSU:9682]|uniref:Rnb-domain-containing protein n=1 Tax=Lichtheimia corymbifera JMRC:FSU:9682 TaxID=1263082 RepID=A0A068S5J1_9FUNG|nr:rnb-domain-containing protein [Lichtheimia corymbifera JMRC:FSU:9682]